MMSGVTAPQQPITAVGDIESGAIGFIDQLESGETLTGSPTITEQTTDDLTISGVAVNSSTLTIDGVSHTAGQAVQFAVSGMLLTHTPYTLKVVVTTSSGRTKNRYIKFAVNGAD